MPRERRGHYRNGFFGSKYSDKSVWWRTHKSVNAYKKPAFSIFSSRGLRAIVISRSKEFALQSVALALAALTLVGGLAHGQEGAQPVSYSLVPTTAMGVKDRTMLIEADGERKKLEASLKDYLVAFDTRHDSSHKKVGLSITSFSGSPLVLGYDPGAKSLMAQVRFGQTINAGLRFEYRAFMGESGTVNFLVSSRF